MKTLRLIFVIFLFLASGCSYMDMIASKAGYDKKARVESQINTLKNERDTALAKQADEITKAKDGLLAQVKKNFQETTNWVYGAFLGSELIQNKDRLDNLINLRLKTALSFSPGPTPEAIVEQNKLLKEELDESRVSNADLAKRYDDKEKEAKAARDAEKEKANTIKDLEKKIIDTEKDYSRRIDVKQDELNKINGELLTLKEKENKHLKENEALKKIMMGWLFAGAALCAIGAYLFRAQELAIGAIICTGLAIAVPFIKTWMVVSGICIIGVIVGLAIYKKYHSEKGIADRALGTIQEVRNDSEQLYQDKLKPKLNEWFADAKHLQDKVEDKLKQLNVK